MVGVLYIDGFVAPLAGAESQALLEKVYSPRSTSGQAIFGSVALLIVGQVLFYITIMVKGVLPRWGALTAAVCLVLYVGGAVVGVETLALIGAVVLAAGLAWLGYALFSGRGEAAEYLNRHQTHAEGDTGRDADIRE